MFIKNHYQICEILTNAEQIGKQEFRGQKIWFTIKTMK